MKIAVGYTTGSLFIEADLVERPTEDVSKIPEEKFYEGDLVDVLKEKAKEYGAVNASYNEKNDTFEVRFKNLRGPFRFMKALS